MGCLLLAFLLCALPDVVTPECSPTEAIEEGL